MNLRLFFFVISIMLISISCSNNKAQVEFVDLQNPIIPGYFADPSLVQHDGKFYMYATADPWGGDFLACWESSDFQNWTFHKLNWPTKELCTSSLSTSSMVWAPSVVKKGDQFYMYVSVGSEVWVGIASHPLGPWKNMLADKPLIQYDTTEYYHTIDAELFVDDDQRSYLYWGSGLNWKNGKCYVAELNDDMCTFRSEKKDITPSNYFEGPLVVKHNSKYFLTYSEGITMDDTYEVRYAVGDSPLGPFSEADNSPILKTNDSLSVYGPGHHTLFSYNEKHYILYHRHRLPFVTGTAYRQICINEISFDDKNNRINNIIPFNTQAFPKLDTNDNSPIKEVSIKASSEAVDNHGVTSISDNSYATRWEAADGDENPYIIAEFKPDTNIKSVGIRFEYAWKTYYPKVEISSDNVNWTLIGDYQKDGVTGSPVNISIGTNVTYLKLSFNPEKNTKVSIWELYFH